jgi:hypothetical protein
MAIHVFLPLCIYFLRATRCVQRGGAVPRGVLLSQADVDLIKAFDRDRDGRLDAAEMDLAQAAFKAFDRGATGAVASAATVPRR